MGMSVSASMGYGFVIDPEDFSLKGIDLSSKMFDGLLLGEGESEFLEAVQEYLYGSTVPELVTDTYGNCCYDYTQFGVFASSTHRSTYYSVGDIELPTLPSLAEMYALESWADALNVSRDSFGWFIGGCYG